MTEFSFFARGADFSVAEIAASTGADWVIEGSVLQSGDRLQVIAQLIDARTDAHIWAADYVRDLQDLLPLQNEIALRLAAAIRAQLGGESGTPHKLPTLPPQVMRDYLRGNIINRNKLAIDSELEEGLRSFKAETSGEVECRRELLRYKRRVDDVVRELLRVTDERVIAK